MQYDPTTTLAIYLIAIAVLFVAMAAIADYSAMKTERRLRDQARAEARAKRQEGEDRSDEHEDFSWQEPSRG